ncbi:hypothetical protein VTI28DRAFT_1054 [Corynascus sepedonium]
MRCGFCSLLVNRFGVRVLPTVGCLRCPGDGVWGRGRWKFLGPALSLFVCSFLPFFFFFLAFIFGVALGFLRSFASLYAPFYPHRSMGAVTLCFRLDEGWNGMDGRWMKSRKRRFGGNERYHGDDRDQRRFMIYACFALSSSLLCSNSSLHIRIYQRSKEEGLDG